jgi:hypothetical protein
MIRKDLRGKQPGPIIVDVKSGGEKMRQSRDLDRPENQSGKLGQVCFKQPKCDLVCCYLSFWVSLCPRLYPGHLKQKMEIIPLVRT